MATSRRFAEVPAKAPEIKPDQLKKPADFRLIGKDVMRVELPSKVNGSAHYGIDVQVPGMLYGTVLRAPVEGSVPDKIDDAKAKAVPGVDGGRPAAAWRRRASPRRLGGVRGAAGADRSVTWTTDRHAWGFDSDKGIDAFAADAKNLAAPARDWSSDRQRPRRDARRRPAWSKANIAATTPITRRWSR